MVVDDFKAFLDPLDQIMKILGTESTGIQETSEKRFDILSFITPARIASEGTEADPSDFTFYI